MKELFMNQIFPEYNMLFLKAYSGLLKSKKSANWEKAKRQLRIHSQKAKKLKG